MTDTVESPRRRRVLATLGSAVSLTGLASTGASATGHTDGDVTVRLNNAGFSAWEITDVDGGESVGPVDEENPTLSLRVGIEYEFENNGWSTHPLAFRDEAGNDLLTQEGRGGSFEGDDGVDWVNADDSLSFVVTEELAEELDFYICTVHDSMRGDIQILGQSGEVASVTISEQTTDGTSVVVDSAQMVDGGFVTIHDSSLRAGETLSSIRGTSEYLEPGPKDNIEVTLDKPLEEDDTLIAMAHKDTNDSEEYEFVSSGGDEDTPYLDTDRNPVTDSAQVTAQTRPPAGAAFPDQTTDGTEVGLDSVRVDDGGFVTIHDTSLQDGEPIASVRGTSEYLDPGTTEFVDVPLDDPIEEDQTLLAMPHRDTNDSQEYDFVESGGEEDGPYVDLEGNPVVVPAEITISGGSDDEEMDDGETDDGTDGEMDDEEMDDGETDDGTDGGTDNETMDNETMDNGTDDGGDGADGSGPGFGPAAGLIGLGGAAAYARRKLGDTEEDSPE